MTVGILMEDGEVITDPTWFGEDDVMRSSHGHGTNRVSGKLIELKPSILAMQAAINKMAVDLAAVTAIPVKLLIEEERCEDYSWLYLSQCAHCLGHVADWESEPKRGE